MKQRLLDWISCPACGGQLSCHSFEEEQDEVTAGLLTCADCSRGFPIHRGVPRLVVDPPYRDADFEQHHGGRVRELLATSSAGAGEPVTGSEGLVAVKEATAASFGYEWTEYARFGWDGKVPTETSERRQAIERHAFHYKSLTEPGELAGKLVLDAGSGNGRYLNQAASLGAEVIGVDLSHAVDAAYANIGRHPNVHVVQGDLFQLPFRPQTFDQIFSIGVLMHTGDARRSFEHLVSRLKEGGTISVHLYGRGNAIYEWVDDRLRRWTTRMDHDRLMRLSKRVEVIPKAVYATRKVTFGKPVLYQFMNCFIRLEFGHHYIFDWYSAPAASHHTYDEVLGWCRTLGVDVVASHSRSRDPLRRLLRSPVAGVTFKGRLTGGVREDAVAAS